MSESVPEMKQMPYPLLQTRGTHVPPASEWQLGTRSATHSRGASTLLVPALAPVPVTAPTWATCTLQGLGVARGAGSSDTQPSGLLKRVQGCALSSFSTLAPLWGMRLSPVQPAQAAVQAHRQRLMAALGASGESHTGLCTRQASGERSTTKSPSH